jgi:two-component system cell cycle response regulator CtrA
MERSMRVLLVEDDVTAARGIALMLKSGGAVVDTADTGEEASNSCATTITTSLY